MVVDFARLSAAVAKHVIDKCDHTMLNDLNLGTISIDGELVEVAQATTVEILAWTFLMRLHADVPEVFKVRLYEGRTAYAEAEMAR